MIRALLLLALASLAGCSGEPSSSVDAGGECPPGDCSAFGKECGQHIDDDGECTFCGRCQAPMLCGGGGQPGMCGCAPPVCGADQCGELVDPCGGPAVACPVTCAGNETCGGGGTANRCGRRAQTGDACSATAPCGDGDVCCEGVCRGEGPGGACPRPGPDLIVDQRVLAGSMIIQSKTAVPTDCAIADGCLTGPGTFQLIRFATETVNVGTADLVIGDPRTAPAEFMFAMCHGHQHYRGYVVYRLVDAQGQPVAEGFKAGFCIEDTHRRDMGPNTPRTPKYFCDPAMGGIQGIQAGWSDLYLSRIDCQWVDITGVPPGNYRLEVEVNPRPRRFHEASYDNNVATATVTIP